MTFTHYNPCIKFKSARRKEFSECENVALIFILFEFYGFYEFLRVSTGFMTLSR